MKQVTCKPKNLGTLLYSKKTKFSCQDVLFHGQTKDKHKKKKRGAISKDGKRLCDLKKTKQAWLLVSH
jgi:hypothetical protein